MKGDKNVTEVENNGENKEPDSDVEDQATRIKRLVEVLKYHCRFFQGIIILKYDKY